MGPAATFAPANQALPQAGTIAAGLSASHSSNLLIIQRHAARGPYLCLMIQGACSSRYLLLCRSHNTSCSKACCRGLLLPHDVTPRPVKLLCLSHNTSYSRACCTSLFLPHDITPHPGKHDMKWHLVVKSLSRVPCITKARRWGLTSFSAMRRSSKLLRFSHLGMAVTLRRATSGWARRPANSTARCCRSTGSSTGVQLLGRKGCPGSNQDGK